MTAALFDTVLVANRGEIAVRIMRTLRRLGIWTATVYSDADADARHVAEAGVAVRIGPAAPAASYLDVDAVVSAARDVGATALHPGYGFLSENAALARACAAAGIVFIGPPASAIETMGDKIRAKQTVAAAGVPVVPGRSERGLDDDALVAAAAETGYPVLLKPSAGGGGKGMRLVAGSDEIQDAIASARAEARSSFGDDTLLVERFVADPRHIEIQVVADTRGAVVHLGERECSLQRRHQKIVEEAPSVLLDHERRSAMGEAAVAAARACGYVSAGTVEFIVSAAAPDDFFFMEMNTRLQVEHPVTEAVYGLDLVELQVRVAAGDPLPFVQAELQPRGHAVEARVYAEDPAHGFLPTGGQMVRLREPTGDGVRVDAGWYEGGDVGSTYDPMLAKIIAWGADREAAFDRLDRALSATVVHGVGTNLSFLRRLTAHPDVRAGRLDTGLVERELVALTGGGPPEWLAGAAAAVHVHRLAEARRSRPAGAWDRGDGWRLGAPGRRSMRIAVPGGVQTRAVVEGAGGDYVVWVDGAGPEAVGVTSEVEGDVAVTVAGRTHAGIATATGTSLWLTLDGETFEVDVDEVLIGGSDRAATGAGPVTSPMPGLVVSVEVAVGDSVVMGAPLVVVEAMKMHHTLKATIDGTVTSVPVVVGQQVVLHQVVAVVTAPSDGA